VIDDRLVAVVGVLAESSGIPDYEGVEVWMPLTAIDDDVTNRAWRGFMALGRLADGATIAAARQELEVRARLAEAYPDSNRDWGLHVLRLRDWVAGPVRPTLWMLFGAVGFVLLIGCANVANLLLVRASRRGPEFAVRAALGAGRPRLVRLLLTESLLLASAGGALGLLVEWRPVRSRLAPRRCSVWTRLRSTGACSPRDTPSRWPPPSSSASRLRFGRLAPISPPRQEHAADRQLADAAACPSCRDRARPDAAVGGLSVAVSAGCGGTRFDRDHLVPI
jgi:hypothetical protein